MTLSLAFSSHSCFCVTDYIVKMYAKIACNISSGRYGVRFQEIQPFFEMFIFFSLIKYILIRNFNFKKSLKNAISGLH